MLLIRLVLLLAIAGGLALFTLSNLQPLSLTFLGIQAPVLPLSLWVLGAIGAGILTSLLLSTLFGLSNYFAARQVRSQVRQASRRTGFQSRGSSAASGPTSAYTSSKDDDAEWRDWEGYEEPVVDRKQAANKVATDGLDDWESEPNDDWENYEPRDTPRPQSARQRDDYEVKQEPKTSSRSGSVYSYGYRDPGNTGVGKTEPVVEKPVVDADYRVIVPPYQASDGYSPSTQYTPPSQDSPEESADDWFEDDSDEFDDGSDRPRRF